IAASKTCVALAQAGAMDEARKVWLSDPLFALSRAHPDTRTSLCAMVQDYGGAHWRDEVTTTYECEPPTPERMRGLATPTLVIGGDGDLESFRLMSDDYAAALPSARRVVVDGAGHMANMESSSRFNAELRALFMAEAARSHPPR